MDNRLHNLIASLPRGADTCDAWDERMSQPLASPPENIGDYAEYLDGAAFVRNLPRAVAPVQHIRYPRLRAFLAACWRRFHRCTICGRHTCLLPMQCRVHRWEREGKQARP